jgi:hypothetical protein
VQNTHPFSFQLRGNNLKQVRSKTTSKSKKFPSTFSIGKTLKEWKPSLAMAAYSGLKSKDELASLDNLLASLICSWNLSKADLHHQ